MALADIADVTTHLPTDRFTLVGGDITGDQLSVERMIKGYLVGVFTPTTLATWTSSTTTPAIIREVAGKMIAGMVYRKRTSEESPVGLEEVNYGQRLYNEALDTLNGIRTGEIDVLAVDETIIVPVGTSGRLSFFPDASTAPVFTMDARF